MVRTTPTIQLSMLIPNSIPALYAPVPPARDCVYDSLGLSIRTDLEPQIHQFLSIEAYDSDSDTSSDIEATPELEPEFPGSPEFSDQFCLSSDVDFAYMNLRRSAWLGLLDCDCDDDKTDETVDSLVVHARTSAQSSTSDLSDSSSLPTPTKSMFIPLTDNSCPPPPRICVTMDAQGQALLDKKLRKMAGWKSKLWNLIRQSWATARFDRP